MGRHTKEPVTPEDVAAVVRAGERLDLATICVRFNGVSRKTASALLCRAVAQGLLVREYETNVDLHPCGKDGKSPRYSVPNTCTNLVPAPYPRVLLGVPDGAAQIGAVLNSHAALAMEIRR